MDKTHVLYIEAEQSERLELTKALTDRGFKVTALDSGRAALETFTPGVHDVILCNLAMPDMDGRTILQEIRSCCSQTPIVLLTTRESVAETVDAVKLGAQHFVLKPPNVDQIEIAVRGALENLRVHQSLERKVVERTESLHETNEKLKEKAVQLEDAALQLGRANVDLLATQEALEEKQAQTEKLLEQLSRGRDELRAILDSSMNATLMVDRENRIRTVNRRVEELFGLKVQSVVNQPFESFAKNIAEHFEEPDALVKRLTTDADSAETPWLSSGVVYDDSFRTKGDKPRDLMIGWTPALSNEDEKTWRVWIFSDVTSLKHADEQLRAIVNASPVPLIVSRVSDGLILYANSHLAQMVGYSTSELAGQLSPDFYYDPGDRQVVLERLARDGFIDNHEVRLKRKDGSVIWCLFSLVASTLAGEPVIIGGLYDISERKEAEEKLKLYRRVFDTSQDGILVFDLNGRLVLRNPAHASISGLTDKEVRGLTTLDLVPEKAREAIRREIEQTGSFRGEVEWPSADGKSLTMDLSVFRIPGPDGEIMYSVGMGRDITERRQAQQAMQQALVELEKTNAELQNAQTQLVQSEKMAALGMLVAGIAHEINTPVGAISSMHDTLVRAMEKLKESVHGCELRECDAQQILPLLDVIDDANQVIKKGTERVTTIVRRLRSFARLDEAELKEVDIHEGIEDTLTLIHHEIKNRIEVVRNFGDIPRVTCFPGRLNQVFLNLLNNARQAIEGEGRITITTAVANGRIEIRFTDTGRGIAPDTVSRVFDPGFTTKGVGVGTGLGLSICYQIIEDHHGHIGVKSRLGTGATFTIVLPTNLDELVDNGN